MYVCINVCVYMYIYILRYVVACIYVYYPARCECDSASLWRVKGLRVTDRVTLGVEGSRVRVRVTLGIILFMVTCSQQQNVWGGLSKLACLVESLIRYDGGLKSEP